MVRRTGRYQVAGLANLETAVTAGRPLIFTAWHGMTMMLAGFFSRNLDLSRIMLILPDDWRGDALAIFAEKLGAHPYPMDLKGKEAGMAAARRLAQLVREVKKGKQAYITPDGPDGPSYQIKPGMAFIAQKTGALILPVGGYARHGYTVPRWDRYLVPYPFARISIAVGEPIDLAAEPLKSADNEQITNHLSNQLHRITMQAAANYYENH